MRAAVAAPAAAGSAGAEQGAHAGQVFGRVDAGARGVRRHVHGDALAVPEHAQLLQRFGGLQRRRGQAWEADAWIGGDIDRLWLRSEGERTNGVTEDAEIQALWGHAISPWWDVLAGVRQDVGEGPSRTWAAIGVQGLAPYKFEVAATASVYHCQRCWAKR